MTKLSKTEKDRIEALYKCQRSMLEQDIQDELKIEMESLIEPIQSRVNELNAEITECVELMEAQKKENNFQNMDRYGCIRNHPRIDKFRAETNAQLMKLWGGEVTTL